MERVSKKEKYINNKCFLKLIMIKKEGKNYHQRYMTMALSQFIGACGTSLNDNLCKDY